MKKKKFSGWIFLDKPIGLSSNLALQKVRKIFNFCKAGYVGTLDPLASGFLPIALGDATKTIKYLESKNKEYVFEVQWGVKTNSVILREELKKQVHCIQLKKQYLTLYLNLKESIFRNHKNSLQKK